MVRPVDQCLMSHIVNPPPTFPLSKEKLRHYYSLHRCSAITESITIAVCSTKLGVQAYVLSFFYYAIVIACCYCTLSSLYFYYFYNVFSYSAIQPQVCNKLSVAVYLQNLPNLLVQPKQLPIWYWNRKRIKSHITFSLTGGFDFDFYNYDFATLYILIV